MNTEFLRLFTFKYIIVIVPNFSSIIGCLGAETCDLEIGDTCDDDYPSTCDDNCRHYMGDRFYHSQCLNNQFQFDYFHCKCFYRCPP